MCISNWIKVGCRGVGCRVGQNTQPKININTQLSLDTFIYLFFFWRVENPTPPYTPYTFYFLYIFR